jgi:hypothetical protein
LYCLEGPGYFLLILIAFQDLKKGEREKERARTRSSEREREAEKAGEGMVAGYGRDSQTRISSSFSIYHSSLPHCSAVPAGEKEVSRQD